MGIDILWSILCDQLLTQLLILLCLQDYISTILF